MVLKDGLLASSATKQTLDADGNPINPFESEEVSTVCDVCGEAEGCISFMEDGVPKTLCFDCIPEGRREELLEIWESGILYGGDGDSQETIVRSTIHHSPFSIPATPISLGMFDKNDDPIERRYAALSQMPIT